jgi:hypothetical protein
VVNKCSLHVFCPLRQKTQYLLFNNSGSEEVKAKTKCAKHLVLKRLSAVARVQSGNVVSAHAPASIDFKMFRCLVNAAADLDILGLYGQANKRTWWMPWRQQAMKDVVARDKLRGAGKQALIRRFPNGETHPQGYPAVNT